MSLISNKCTLTCHLKVEHDVDDLVECKTLIANSPCQISAAKTQQSHLNLLRNKLGGIITKGHEQTSTVVPID